MASDKGKVQIGAGRFPAGTKIALVERVGDGRAKVVKRAKVGKDSTAEFSGLPAGQPFFVVGEVDGQEVVVNVTAKGPAVGDDQPRPDPETVRANLKAQAAARGVPGTPVVEGLRSTVTSRPRSAAKAEGQDVDPKRSRAAKKAARTRARKAKAKK